MKVLHTPHNNGGHRWLISREERKLGLQSDLVVLYEQPFYKNYDRSLHLKSWGPFNLAEEKKRGIFLAEAIKKYDVFHFNAGASIVDHPIPGLNLRDLPQIKAAGKKIIVTYQGDDCRQKDYYIKNYGIYYRGKTRWYSPNDWYLDMNKRLRVKIFDRYADHILAISPDILNFLPKRTELLPTCVDFKQLPTRISKKDNQIRFVHAPSDRGIKGTEKIIEVINRLKQKYPIELVLIEKMSHKEALEAYRSADIGIDQLIVGWYGTFAVELMAMGIPVVAYLREDDLRHYVPWRKEIPVVSSSSQNLEKTLIKLIENKKLREEIGRKSVGYVREHHDSKKAARRLKEIYQQ